MDFMPLNCIHKTVKVVSLMIHIFYHNKKKSKPKKKAVSFPGYFQGKNAEQQAGRLPCGAVTVTTRFHSMGVPQSSSGKMGRPVVINITLLLTFNLSWEHSFLKT